MRELLEGFNNTTFVLIAGVIEILVLVRCYFYAGKIQRPLFKEMQALILPTISILLSKNLLLLITNHILAYILYLCFDVSHLWLYLAFLWFVYGISNVKMNKKVFGFLIAICVIDTAGFIVNYFTSHMFSVSVSSSGAVQLFTRGTYLVHPAVLIIFTIYICAILINRMRSIHYIYWPRYIFYLVIGCYATYYDVAGSGDQEFFNKIGMVHFCLALLAFLFTQVFTSKLFRTYEYSEALDSISQYFFLLDNEGVCVLANKPALDYFDIDPFDMSSVEEKVLGIVDREAIAGQDIAEINCRYKKDGEIRNLRLDYKRLLHGGKFSGEIFGFTDTTAEQKEIIAQKKKARYDSFSEIYNRDWLFASIEKVLENDPEGEYLLIGSDIRDFKVFNDVFGKEAGDVVIKKSAEVLRNLYAKKKILMFGRIFGDRFGMLAKKGDCTDSEIVNAFLAIDHPLSEEYYHLNIHFGVYNTTIDKGLSVSSMFDRAYVALDSIKNDVNIRIYHYNTIMRDEKVWEQTISANIEKALKDGQLRIVVQPQVDRDQKIIGGEALVRWRHPENGEISPGNFIPVLEKTGLVTTADIFVWEECCKLLRRWKDLGYEDYYISVNISPIDFIFSDIYTIFTNLVEKYQINPKNLKLEITETAMMTDVLERIVLIKRLEEYGFSVELDDFGSGYSSLNMLKEIPVDVIKMDMKFLYNYNDDATSNSRKVIGHIIHMAKDLNMDIVAEGVETKEQLEFLSSVGCDVFQGYYFSKPVEVIDFEKLQGIA